MLILYVRPTLTYSVCFSDDNSTIESTASSSPVSSIDYLPPCDRSATDIKQAYKIYDLVSKDVLDSLDTIAKEVSEMDLISLVTDSRCELLITSILFNKMRFWRGKGEIRENL